MDISVSGVRSVGEDVSAIIIVEPLALPDTHEVGGPDEREVHG